MSDSNSAARPVSVSASPQMQATRQTVMGFGPTPSLELPGITSHQEVIFAAEPAMTMNQLQDVILSSYREAKHYDDRLAAARSNSLRLYNGEPIGDEEPGRSSVILTEVRDTVQAMMPTIVRVFAGTERPVEFLPNREADSEQAQQATDYVEYVAFVENDGFRAVMDAVTDAMQLKTGWLHWWWDWSINVRAESYTGLLEPQAAALLTDPAVRALKVIRRPATEEEQAGLQGSPESQVLQLMPGTQLLVYDCNLVRRTPANRPRLAALASELVLIDPDASGPEDARFMAIVRIRTVSDMVALGFDKATIERNLSSIRQNQNRVTRRRDRLAAVVARAPGNDPAMREVRHLELWIRADMDGDGIAEMLHCDAVGNNAVTLLAWEPCGAIPIARVAPYPVPHRAHGESMADRIGDIQRIMTRVMRNILDSMSESIHPRTTAEEGAYNHNDLLNTEMGAIIRIKKAGAVQELQKPFIGPQALPIAEAVQAIKEQRTGITKATQGLTADAMQSTTAIGISAQVSAAQDRLDLVVRCIAEGLKYAYSGLLEMLATHQDRARTVQLRGKWVPVDPRSWVQRFHVRVRVGIGRGSLIDRQQALGVIITKQEMVLDKFGPNNPVVSLDQWRNTVADMAATAGIVDVGRYFNALPAGFELPPPPPPAPTDGQLVAQTEQAKIAANEADSQNQLLLKREQAYLDDDFKRDQARVDALLQAADLQGKWGFQIDPQALAAMMERDPAASDLRFEQAHGGTPFVGPNDVSGELLPPTGIGPGGVGAPGGGGIPPSPAGGAGVPPAPPGGPPMPPGAMPFRHAMSAAVAARIGNQPAPPAAPAGAPPSGGAAAPGAMVQAYAPKPLGAVLGPPGP